MIIYMGSFPPPYGGVTVKNELLFSVLRHIMGACIKKIDTQRAKKNPLVLASQGLTLLLNRKHPMILATAGVQRRHITIFLNHFNRKLLRKSILIVMGGSFADRVKNDRIYLQGLRQYRRLYVETAGMAREMMDIGLTNVAVYPNCRLRSASEIHVRNNLHRPLHVVFFSLVSPDKGADIVLETAKQLPDVLFDFYGVLDPAYQDQFLLQIESIPNARYQGVFHVKNDNVYAKLNEYDVLLLPTRWLGEGIPGILVESKIAAVPAVVSNLCYNSEIIENGVSGIVMKDNTTEELVAALMRLDADREMLTVLKRGAKASAEQYYLDHYLDELITDFTEM